MTEELNLIKEKKEILNAYKGLLRASKQVRSSQDTKKIRKAFNVALDAHKDIRRKSGEPYIYHPIAVARICVEEMGLDTTAIIAALLHDTVEDTAIKLQDIEDLFGKKIRMIIDGLTKIPNLKEIDEKSSLQIENYKKLILTISDDLRVVMIKIADRLHNMRTLGSVQKKNQLKTSSETQFLYVALAHRLGLHSIKTELEDLALKYKNPIIYNQIETNLKKSKDIRDRFIRRFNRPIKERLIKNNFKFELKARTKSISSIYNKMKKQNIPFEEVFDIFAIRIIIDSKKEYEKSNCWKIYSIITDFYQPNPDRLRDWISTPRANGYESLHTTVMSPTGKWVEVQIRTRRMDDIAEKGLAAHYKYKENNKSNTKFDRWISEVRDLLENPNPNALDLVDEFKLNLFSDEIYVFTPKGDLKVLPKNASILDFAFDIHTDIGMKCIGGKVNNKLKPISHKLKSGDQVDIITSKTQKAKEDWLHFVVSARSKNKIKSSLNEEFRLIAEEGKEILMRKFKQLKINPTSENITVAQKYYHINKTSNFYFQIAKRKIDLSKIRKLDLKHGNLKIKKDSNKLNPNKLKEVIERVDKKKDIIFIGDDFKELEYKLSPCCSPIPGDEIFGFITISNGIKIHRSSCPNATQMLSNYEYRVIKARWNSQKIKEREVDLYLEGNDNLGLVNKVTNIISTQHQINMKNISFEANNGKFIGKIKVLVYDTKDLDELISNFEKLEGIFFVKRTTNKIEFN